MGKAALMWLDNLPAECITSWETLSRLFTTNYQATYNRPGNTYHLARVRMRSGETLREYTNHYFENRNTLAGVKDDDVISYYKKGITNIKLFEKIHEASTIVTVNLIDEITVTASPIVAIAIGIDVMIAATTVAMTDVTTTVATTAVTGATTTEAIVVMIAVMIATTTNETTDMMIDVARTTTVPVTTTARSGLHRHHPKGATPMVHSRRPTARSISSLEVAKRPKATDRLDQTPGRSVTLTPRIRDLCGGLNSKSLSLGKIIGFISPTS
jgi:hypothetical protein